MSYLAILLCAGYGTRMGALTARTPKPLLEVGGRPMLDPLLDQIERMPGLEAVHIVTNQRHAEAFATWCDSRRRGETSSLDVVLHDDGSTSNEDRLGAIGDLEFVLRRLGTVPEGALVCAGDNILRFDLVPFWRRFQETGQTRILALEEKDRARLQRTGVLELDGDRVEKLHEKPEDPPSTWSSPACYALGREALAGVGEYLEAGGSRDEIGRFIAHLVQHQEVRAFRLQGQRLHVGNPQELERANALLSRGTVLTSDGEEVS